MRRLIVTLALATAVVVACSSSSEELGPVVPDAGPEATAPESSVPIPPRTRDASVDGDAGADGDAGVDGDAADSGVACRNGIVESGEQCDDGNASSCDGCESCETRRWLNLPAGAFVESAGAAASLPAGNACFEAWVKTDGAVGDAIYMSSYGAGNNGSFILRCFQSGTRLQFASETAGNVLVTQPLLACGDNQWHHVAGCRSVSGTNMTLNLFWDGQLAGTAAGTTASLGANTTLVLGGVTYAHDGLGGSIDEVRVSKSVRYTSAFAPQRRLTPDADTVLLYHFDEANGASVADASGNALSATATGSSRAIDTGYSASFCAACGNGIVESGEECDDGNAASCDGCEGCKRRQRLNLPATAWGQVSSITSSLPRGNACFEAWVKTDGTVNDAIYLSSYGVASDGAFILRCQSGTQLQFASETAGNLLATAPAIACGDNQWHHVAGCRSVSGANMTLNLFWDGQLAGTAAGTTASLGANAALALGGVTYAHDGLGGSIDEVRISDTIRYAGTFSPVRRFAPDANTVALYHLDEAGGSTFGDASGHGFSGTLSGATFSADTGYKASLCP